MGRYPSSSLLRACFPDVQFNRCITSQMIKWFSNFREFYYIQMEKYARQALSDGVTNAQALAVLRDSELFRVLNTHYNKGNDFEGKIQILPGRNPFTKSFQNWTVISQRYSNHPTIPRDCFRVNIKHNESKYDGTGLGFQEVSLCSPGCPGTHSVDHAGLELRNPPASASQSAGITGVRHHRPATFSYMTLARLKQ
ncbi:Prospero homeobox protein 2 [Apodemus speciosus]|uniref:Prospero homeobox protein 2 n=1 Tax=Apodemus speciosus TaxID=105296 RepID=A0ABQ0FEG1_APOSI